MSRAADEREHVVLGAPGWGATRAEDRRRAAALLAEGTALEHPRAARGESTRALSAEARRAAGVKYAEAIRLCPTLAEGYIRLASVERQLGNRARAREHAERALALRPRDAMAYSLLSSHFEGEDRRRVLRAGTRVPGARSYERSMLAWNVAKTYWYEGRFETCARSLRALLGRQRRALGARSGALAPTYASLASALEACGDHRGAERAHRAILTLRRAGDDAIRRAVGADIVLARLRGGDLAGAREALVELRVEIDPDERMLLAAALPALAGETPRCSARLLRIIERDESDTRAAFYGAIVLHALGRRELAIPRLRRLAARWERNRREWGVTLRWEIARAKELLAADSAG